jgi:hypothetical protein
MDMLAVWDVRTVLLKPYILHALASCFKIQNFLKRVSICLSSCSFSNVGGLIAVVAVKCHTHTVTLTNEGETRSFYEDFLDTQSKSFACLHILRYDNGLHQSLFFLCMVFGFVLHNSKNVVQGICI